MLGGLALKWRWRDRPRQKAGPSRRQAESRNGRQCPGLLGGSSAATSTSRPASYRSCPWRSPTSRPRAPSKACDENTIGVVAVLGLDLRRGLRASRPDPRPVSTPSRQAVAPACPYTSTAPPGGLVAPFLDPELVWDFQLARGAVDQCLGAQESPPSSPPSLERKPGPVWRTCSRRSRSAQTKNPALKSSGHC